MPCSTRLLFLAAMVCVLQGCNTMAKQPEFVRAGIQPDQLQPGDVALITVDVQDKHGIVNRIEGVVQEDPRITFNLNDAGENSDEQPDDGVWSFGVKVPFQAPSGTFMLDLVAFRDDGVPVTIRDEDGNVAPLKRTVPLAIQAPAAPVEPTEPAEPGGPLPAE